MRYKVAPEPADRDTLEAAHRAVPLVPGSTDDCCARLQSRLDLATRDDAREWLTFLDALGLARETGRGYERVREDPTAGTLASGFREQVFGVRELLAALTAADEPVSVDAAFSAVEEMVPTWERNRHGDWRAVWHDRIETLLSWAVLFDLAESDQSGFRARGE